VSRACLRTIGGRGDLGEPALQIAREEPAAFHDPIAEVVLDSRAVDLEQPLAVTEDRHHRRDGNYPGR